MIAHRSIDNVLMIKVYYRVSASFASIEELKRLSFDNEVFEETRIDEDDVIRLKRKFDSKTKNDELSIDERFKTGNRR